MRAELVYMQYNISDSQTLFSCSVIILEMASLDTFLPTTQNFQENTCPGVSF